MWQNLSSHPEVTLKRQLWDRLLRVVYGTAVGDDSLFLQHTYLTIVAKTVAVRVLDLPAVDAVSILSGQSLADAGIHGAVESDFFDWVSSTMKAGGWSCVSPARRPASGCTTFRPTCSRHSMKA